MLETLSAPIVTVPSATSTKSSAVTPRDVLAERDRPAGRVAAVLGFGPTRVIETTVGAVLSITIVWPVKLPLPVPVPPSLLPTSSVIESSSVRSRRSVPSPAPVVTVTVSVALGPPGVTEMMPSPAIELPTSTRRSPPR